MKVMNTIQVNRAISDLPFPQHVGIKHIKAFVLPWNLSVEQWTIPAGTTVKIWTSTNFGYVLLPKECKELRGFTMERQLFRW